MRTYGLVVALLAPIFGGCGLIGGPETPQGPPGPAVAWQLSVGTDFRTLRPVCSGINPGCRLPASSKDRPTYASLMLRLSPGQQPIQYTGAAIIGFIPSPRSVSGYEMDLNYRVDPGAQPVGVSVNGIVTDKPGQYAIDFRVLGGVEKQTGDPKQVLVQIPVTVTSASAQEGP